MNFKSVKVPKVPGGGAASALVKVGILGALGLYGAANSLYNVDGGHQAIVFNHIYGIKDEVYPEGTHFMIPWFERPVIYDVHARPHLVESTSERRDLQMGEAKSAQLIGHAIANNPAFITLRQIEASREIAHTLSNASNKILLNSNDLLLNLSTKGAEAAATAGTR